MNIDKTTSIQMGYKIGNAIPLSLLIKTLQDMGKEHYPNAVVNIKIMLQEDLCQLTISSWIDKPNIYFMNGGSGHEVD